MTEHTTATPAAPPVEDALASALSTIRRNIQSFGDRYPDDTTVDGVYQLRVPLGGLAEGSNHGWTTGFWPGMLWLAYDLTGERSFREAGESHVSSFRARIDEGIDLDTHDLGFLYTLACVAPYRVTGDAIAKETALLAADLLMQRFLEPAGIVQAWGDLTNAAERGRTIIDSLMNMPLLFWASEVSGDSRYADAARRHTTQLCEHIIRPDDSTFHTFHWDPETGRPLHGATAQGHSDDSCWARGQAWGIYGFALNHGYTGDAGFLAAARRCADYFLDHLPSDHVAYWDLVFSDGSVEERDSSAAAIAVCGLDLLAQQLSEEGCPERYREAADAILTSLIKTYSAVHEPTSNALLLQGVYSKPHGGGVDEGNLWGDYFYMESLVRRAEPSWRSYW